MGVADTAWTGALELCADEVRDVAVDLRDLGLPPPEVGWEPVDATGRVEGSQVELAWPTARIAIFFANQVSAPKLDAFHREGWQQLVLPASETETHEFLGRVAGRTTAPAAPRARVGVRFKSGRLVVGQPDHPLVERLRRELGETTPHLPDWVAACAAGEPPPAGLDDELLEDIRALPDQLDLPRVVAPAVAVRSRGVLTETGGDQFHLEVTLKSSGGASAQRDGAAWTAGAQTFLLPQDLRTALDQIAEGPPAASTGDRMLWWAGIRPVLERHGAELIGYVKDLHAVRVDRVRPKVEMGPDGPELRVQAEGISTDELTEAADRINPRRPADPTLLQDTESGKRRVRVALTDETLRALSRVRQLRDRQRQARKRGVPWPDLANLLDAPESILPEDMGFDLSLYSPRVVGISDVVYRVSKTFQTDGTSTLVLRRADTETEDRDWTHAELELLSQLLRQADRANKPYVRFSNAWVRVPPQEVAEELGEQARRAGAASSQKPELIPAVNLEELAYAPDDEGVGVVADVPDRPPGMAGDFTLQPHQVFGVRWLAGHARVGPNATDHGMLADDMGLGKTLQVLSVLAHRAASGDASPALIVAPVSLLKNWCDEADRFFPGRFANRVILRGATDMRADQLRTRELVLTSYETLRSQQLLLGAVRWKTMVCDECHVIRNPTAKVTRAIWSMNAEVRLALTGTPIHNSLDDLWSQFDWLAPGWLGDRKTFQQTYPSESDEAREHLRKRVHPRMLRRTKEDLAASLPPKHIHRIPIPLRPEQEDLYDAVLRDRPPERGSFGTIHQLFQACSDPHALGLEEPSANNPKLAWLFTTLDRIAKLGEKVVIFAEWYALQDRVIRELERRYDIPVDRVNGTVEAGRRVDIVTAFNRAPGFQALVLGPRAAGVGLNVTGANHVVHLTRHWNPALEQQATDRVHRIGQTRDVHVYLPIATHSRLTSIEEHLDGILADRRAMASDILSAPFASATREELARRAFGSPQGSRSPSPTPR